MNISIKLRKTTLLILILVSLCINPQITISVGAEDPSGGIIDGDSVYWENDWGRLEVYPHTGYGSTYIQQWCNATWKLSANNLDIAFRFNDSIANANIYELVGEEWIDRTSAFQHTIYNDKYIYYVTNVHFDQDETRRFRFEYSVQMNTTGKWDFMAKLSSESIQYALDNNRYVMCDPWWDVSWSRYTICSIDSTYVDTDLLNFPVLVTIPSSIGTHCNDGDSIRFLNMDNTTEYYYEIETFDASSNSYVWVNISSIQSDSDTQFLMYYDNDVALDDQTPTQVWNDNYVGVWHMKNGTDSTNSYNNATDRTTLGGGSSVINITSGRIGSCKDFESANQAYMNVSHTESLNLNDTTIEIWITTESTATFYHMINKELVGTNINYDLFGIKADHRYSFETTNDQALGNISFAGSPWFRYVAATRDVIPGSDNITIYNNGTIDGALLTITDGDVTNNAELLFGIDGDLNDWFDGKIDEVRISNIARNASWINASYNSANSTTFCVLGTEQAKDVFHMNGSANITRTVANLTGWIPNTADYVGTYDAYGVWVGENSGLAEGTYDFNFTGDGTKEPSEEIDVGATGLTENTKYYFKGWIANGTSFEISDNELDFTTLRSPEPPTNVGTSIEPSNSSLLIIWDIGIASDKTVIIRKVGSLPSSIIDGTEVFNASDEDYWEEDLASNYRYRIWSWNDALNVYSVDYVDIEYSALILHCYNESNPSENLTYDIEIKNSDGSQVYTAAGIGDGFIVDVGDIPFGINTRILVNSTGYNSRIYYYDLEEDTVYNLSFYLPNASLSELYLLHVQDRADQPLDLVKIQVQRYINTTGVYENVSIVLTDGNGDVLINLIPNTPYQITLTKDLYVTQIADYTTSPDVFVKNFVMDLVGVDYPVNTFEDIIDFTGEWDTSNNTLHIRYFDKNTETINTSFQIWEVFDFTESLNATYEFTTENDFHIYVAGLNLNRTHRIELNLNHTTLGIVINQSVYVFPAFKPDATIRDLSWLENLFGDNYGDFELGYVNSLLIFLPCLSIIIVFAKHPGLGVLGSASWITLISWYMEVTLALLGVASLLFTIGFIIIFTKRGKKVTT